jgi:glycosyltransferase involved in cell wall biosynthesis
MTDADPRLRVCLDARLVEGRSGGLEQVVIGLAHGLSQLSDGDEEYLFLGESEQLPWLEQYLDGRMRILVAQNGGGRTGARRSLASVPGAKRLWHMVSPRIGTCTALPPKSDGVIEAAGIDVMHFTRQSAFRTAVPSIFHPHDLQHVHFPEYFNGRARLVRETYFRILCAQARVVAVASGWVKHDLIDQYSLEPRKVAVIRWAPPVDAYPRVTETDIRNAREKFSLSADFALYPAQTWPHKNHIRLLDALATLRDRENLIIPLVSCGHLTPFYAEIEAHARSLGLMPQTRWLGFVSPRELVSLYRLAKLVIIPTTFEAASFPLWEAFACCRPAACSNVTSLPEQAGDAALLFNPMESNEIGSAMARLWCDAGLRETLVHRGAARLKQLSWSETARRFRAHYRHLGGSPLTSEDRELLEEGVGACLWNRATQNRHLRAGRIVSTGAAR